jgi:hypothetical protein
MKKILLTALTLGLLAAGTTVVFAATGGDATTTATTGTSTTRTTEDISGPCDEAEHANDPRCTGAAVGDDDDAVEDNSGPSMNSGPGSVSSGHDEIGDDSGSGSSGHGGGGDD